MSGYFDGQVALVTGASSGIGAAVAEEFARQGAKVVLLARRLERLESVKQSIENQGGQALALACDITDRPALDAAVAKAVDTFGRLDIVLANAGIGISGLIQRLSTDDFRRQFETNVFGVLETVLATIPHLAATRGRLALVGSVSGRIGTPTSSPYTASKFAVVGLAECLYYDLAPQGISVTCINPGFVSSEIRSINNKGEHTGKPDPVPQWLVMSAPKAAQCIVHGIYRRKPEVVVTFHGKAMIFFARHFPRLTREFILLGSKGRLDKIQNVKPGG